LDHQFSADFFLIWKKNVTITNDSMLSNDMVLSNIPQSDIMEIWASPIIHHNPKTGAPKPNENPKYAVTVKWTDESKGEKAFVGVCQEVLERLCEARGMGLVELLKKTDALKLQLVDDEL
jgi:hypothetical protein